MEGPIADLDGD